MKNPQILVFSPDSTSSKIALFNGKSKLWQENVFHSLEEISGFSSIAEQKDFRSQFVRKAVRDHGVDTFALSAIITRGGFVRPVEAGVWRVNRKMVDELLLEKRGAHIYNLGAIVAFSLAIEWGVEAWIADPPVVDEMDEIARISGMPEIQRKSVFHALNHKAVARKYAEHIGKRYEDLRLIVVHLGEGVSVGVHKDGKVIDVNNALDGEGPFSLERSGSLPVGELVKLCFSGKYSYEKVMERITKKGGLVAYLGTGDMVEIRERIERGDSYAKLIYDAMVYQIGKEVGAAATVLEGDVDVILITGSVAQYSYVVDDIREMVDFISDVVVYPGEDEISALVEAAMRVLSGEEEVKEY